MGRGHDFGLQVSKLLYALLAGIASDIVTGRTLTGATVYIRRISHATRLLGSSCFED